MKISDFLDRFVFVGKCPSCREMLPYEMRAEAFCEDCRAKWDKEKAEYCSACGAAVCECTCMPSALEKAGALCYHKMVKYSSYNPVVHNTVMFLKKNKNPRVAGFLASQLVSVISADDELPELTPDNTVATFVPRGRKAVIKHGFDQAELIARAFAEQTGFEYVGAIRRRRGGIEQKRLSATDRAKNVKHLFEPDEENISAVRDKYVVLIDDIVTTGASMAACVSLLIRARARAVVCLSVCYTEKEKKRN